MARYFFNPENYSVGDVPSELSVYSTDTADASFSIQEDGNGDKYLEVLHEGGDCVIGLDAAEADGSEVQEVWVECEYDETSPGAGLHGSTANDGFYWARIWNSGNVLYKYLEDDSGRTELVTGSSFGKNTFYRQRLQIDANGNLRARTWERGTGEPGSWGLTATNTDLTNHAPGVVAYGGGNQTVLIYGIGVGTEGDSAPSSELFPPQLNTPADADTVVRSVTFDWEAVGAADSYDIQVAVTSAFNNPFVDTNTSNTSFTENRKLISGEMFWRVRSVESGGATSGWSPVRSMTVEEEHPFTGSRLATAGEPIITADSAFTNLGFPQDQSLEWWSGYRSSDWPEIDNNQNYFFICSTGHTNDGKIYLFEADDEVGTNMTYRGVIWSNTDHNNEFGTSNGQGETPQLIYAPDDPNGRVLHLTYHVVRAGDQPTYLISSAGGGALHNISWTGEGPIIQSDASSDAHGGYITRQREGGKYMAWGLGKNSNSTDDERAGYWEGPNGELDGTMPSYENVGFYGSESTDRHRNHLDNLHFYHNGDRYIVFFVEWVSGSENEMIAVAPRSDSTITSQGEMDRLFDLTTGNEDNNLESARVLPLFGRDGFPIIENGKLTFYVTRKEVSGEMHDVFAYQVEGVQPSSVRLVVHGPNRVRLDHYGRGDLSESGSGPYSYALAVDEPFDDGAGTYEAVLDKAVDGSGNDISSGESDTHTV